MNKAHSKRKLNALNIHTTEHLCRHLGTSIAELERICQNPAKYYKQYPLKVKGKTRFIATPLGRLRFLLDKLQPLLQRLKLHESLQGGIQGKSIITNASPHIGKPAIIKLDLKDFFPRINNKMVYRAFLNRLGCSPNVAHYLTMLTTLHGHLPQGSPTSTILSAIVVEPMAIRIARFAKIHGAEYTQWVDDITISGPVYIIHLIYIMEKIIKQEGFCVNEEKTQIIRSVDEQVVTGIRVNRRMDAPSLKIREVRIELLKLQGGESILTDKLIASLKGKIRYIIQLNPGAGKHLNKKLNKIIRHVHKVSSHTSAPLDAPCA